ERSALEHARASPAAAGAFPGVLAEVGAVEAGDGGADAVLQLAKEAGRAGAEVAHRRSGFVFGMRQAPRLLFAGQLLLEAAQGAAERLAQVRQPIRPEQDEDDEEDDDELGRLHAEHAAPPGRTGNPRRRWGLRIAAEPGAQSNRLPRRVRWRPGAGSL